MLLGLLGLGLGLRGLALLGLLECTNKSEIVLGMLKAGFCRHPVAG
ncbi:hypothetical protein WCLP8_4570007 [uncultured Gammaproteobacteria bacterium]